MSHTAFDTNCMTLTRFVLQEQKKHKNATGDLSQLLNCVQTAVKACPLLSERLVLLNCKDMSHPSLIKCSITDPLSLPPLATESLATPTSKVRK